MCAFDKNTDLLMITCRISRLGWGVQVVLAWRSMWHTSGTIVTAELSRRVQVDLPDGLAVLGDAACCFNPVYGQGMASNVFNPQCMRSPMHALPWSLLLPLPIGSWDPCH
jgi:hypothetical protein